MRKRLAFRALASLLLVAWIGIIWHGIAIFFFARKGTATQASLSLGIVFVLAPLLVAYLWIRGGCPDLPLRQFVRLGLFQKLLLPVLVVTIAIAWKYLAYFLYD